LGISISSCSTSKKATKGPAPSKKNNKTAVNNKKSKKLAKLLSSNRSQLSDVFNTQKDSIPPIFQKVTINRNSGADDQGYRVQILSIRDASQADSVAKHFRSWADSVMAQYVPKDYVLFKPPYYKVRVGDFENYNRAQKLNRMLKSRYPGAWVVHSVIKPDLVPADTVKFKPKKVF
jgi:mRNA-degrading endonuclease RelE of RelBE toxin-antitoxin system